jgi:BetR domain.
MNTKINQRERKKIHSPYFKFEYLLKERGVNYKYLSTILNISISAVSDKINGWSDFTMEEIITICDNLNCSSNIFTQ